MFEGRGFETATEFGKGRSLQMVRCRWVTMDATRVDLTGRRHVHCYHRDPERPAGGPGGGGGSYVGHTS